MAACQTAHCAELLSAPDVIPLAREGTQSQSTDSSISHFIIGLPSHSKSRHCFGSVLWCCSFFLCKLVWSVILSSGLWRASYRNRGVELSFRGADEHIKDIYTGRDELVPGTSQIEYLIQYGGNRFQASLWFTKKKEKKKTYQI